MENQLSVQAYSAAVAMQCSVYEVLDRWGMTGTTRDAIERKVRVIVEENNAFDRERMDKAKAQAQAARTAPK